MKVVLLTHVPGLGQKGEIKEVAEGYFRNALAPRRLAAAATHGAIKHLNNQQAKATEKLEAMKESADAVKSKVDGKGVDVEGKASEGTSLYAAISAKEVAAAIKDQLKAEVPAKCIEMDTIKEAGDFKITLKLHKDVTAEITVHVIAK